MSEDATIVIRVQNAPEDLAALERNIGGEAGAKKSGLKLVAAPAALAAFIALVPMPYWLSTAFGIAYELGAIASVFVIGLVFAFTLKQLSALKAPEVRDPQSSLWTPQEFAFSDEGVQVKSAHSETRLEWPAFRKACETLGHVFLFIDQRMAYAVPKRSLTPEQEASLIALLRAHLKLETR
jgi:hypothetical protein